MTGSLRAFAPSFMLFLFLFAGLNNTLFAGGSKEDRISTVRQYIEEKKYDPALALLAEIIKSDSSRFDEAYALVQLIQLRKGDYNQYLKDLYDILTTDPGNYQRALDAINKMTELDPHPSERNRQKIEDFRIVAKITKDRDDKNKLMERALAQIQQKDYLGAIDTYLSGFDLQSSDFLIGTQKPEFRSAVADLVDQIQGSIGVFKTENANLMPGLEKFAQDLKGGAEGLDRVAAALPVFSAQFLITINQTVRIEKFSEEASALRVRSDIEYPPSDKRNYNYNEHIRFIQEFMLGPPGKTGQGIAYAARSMVDNEYADTLARLEALYTSRKQELATLQLDQRNDLSPAFTAVALAGNILMRAYGLKGSVDLGNKPTFADLNSKLSSSYRKVPASILYELHAYGELEFILKQKTLLDTLNARTNETVWREALVALDKVRTVYTAWVTETQSVQDLSLIDRATVEKGRAIFVAVLTVVQDGLLSLARNRFSGIASGSLEAVRTPFVSSAMEEKLGLEQLNGPANDSPRETKVVYHYPELALGTFNSLRSTYQTYLKSLDDLDNSITNGRTEVRDYAPVQTTAKASQNLRKQILDAIARLDNQISRAQVNIKTAQERAQMAAAALTAAEASISGNSLQVDKADKSFTDASDLYFQSFDIAYDKAQRSLVDSKLQALRIKIDDARNLTLIQKKSEFINKAITSFERDQYQAAAVDIDQAATYDQQTVSYQQSIAAGKTPAEAFDPLIPYWRNRIQAAVNLSSERTIPESDPEFFPLSNYLNLAKIDYVKAGRLLENSKKPDAVSSLDHASGLLDNILFVKPNNKDAKLLKLKIERIRDPANFDQLYPIRVRTAIVTANTKPSFNALTDLLSYKDIKPDNSSLTVVARELDQSISRLRITLGLDPSPLTVANRQESLRLYAVSVGLAKSTRQADLRKALDNLNSALRLDPTNRNASGLADTVRAKLRDIPDSLTFEEEQTYNNAVLLFSGNDTLNANIAVTELLKKHPNLPKLIKLRNQINLKLGL